MRVKYIGKFRKDLSDYINEKPYMFELDGCGLSFWELPVEMQWGVVIGFSHGRWQGFQVQSYSDIQMKVEIERFQKWYNENN